MQLFYTDLISEDELFLTPEEAHHAARVLRLRKGDVVHATDGKGTLYKGTIEHLDHKQGMIRKISSEYFSPRTAALHIAIAPTKNIDRFEWFLEKACEFGIERITPIVCKRSERKDIRTDRLNKILLSGMKQSLHYYLPVLEEPTPFVSFIENPGSSYIKCIAHCEKGEKTKLSNIFSQKRSSLVMIGPEGDFTPEEISAAVKTDFTEITLGSSRLRTETAGIAVAHSFAEALDSYHSVGC